MNPDGPQAPGATERRHHPEAVVDLSKMGFRRPLMDRRAVRDCRLAPAAAAPSAALRLKLLYGEEGPGVGRGGALRRHARRPDGLRSRSARHQPPAPGAQHHRRRDQGVLGGRPRHLPLGQEGGARQPDADRAARTTWRHRLRQGAEFTRSFRPDGMNASNERLFFWINHAPWSHPCRSTAAAPRSLIPDRRRLRRKSQRRYPSPSACRGGAGLPSSSRRCDLSPWRSRCAMPA
jgi:hypothetical protein